MDDLPVNYTIEEIAEMAIMNKFHTMALHSVLIERVVSLTKAQHPEVDAHRFVKELNSIVLLQFQSFLEEDDKISEYYQNQLVASLKRELNLPE